MSIEEARYAVDLYYQVQEFRKASANQVREQLQAANSAEFLHWVFQSMATIEDTVKAALDKYSASTPLGEWARSITGIGPVLTAGLLAHVDMSKVKTAGQIWRFAGYDPTVTWEKGQKRPHNARLKTLCWKIGESFIKTSGLEDDIYGKVYIARKQQEIEANENRKFRILAEKLLASGRYKKDTAAKRAYLDGKLPPAHLHARARRYAVKLFLSAYFEVGYWLEHRHLPPKPYAIDKLGHMHYFGVPNEHLVPGLSEARRTARLLA